MNGAPSGFAICAVLTAGSVLAAPASVSEGASAVAPLALSQEVGGAVESDSSGEHRSMQPLSDLEGYLRQGVEGNPEIRAARERLTAAAARVPQVTALAEPQLRYAWFPRAIQTRTGPQRNRIGVTQMFPWFGVRSRKGALASREADRRAVEIDKRVVELVRRIKHAYYDYGFLAEEVRVTSDSLSLLQQLEPIVQRKFQTGASQGDLLRVQMEIGRVEDRLVTLNARRPVLSARLAAEVGAGAREPLPWPRLQLPAEMNVDRGAVIAAVGERNRELGILDAEIAREEAGVELASLADRPSFGLAFDYLETGAALNREAEGSGADPFSLSAMISIPVWRDKYAGARSEAIAKREDARLRREDRFNRLTVGAEMALFALEDADRKMSLYRDTLVPRARQTLVLTQRSYQAGAATILDWIDTERELLEFDRSLYRAAADFEKSLADIEALCGGDLP